MTRTQTLYLIAERDRLMAINAQLLEALQALLAEATQMNAVLRTMGMGRPDDGAHPDAPIDQARAAIDKATNAHP